MKSVAIEREKIRQRERERMEKIMRTPVNDFELSVRSRNCLAKMNIFTLGDLLNPVDRVLAWLNPEAGLRRVQQRHALAGLVKAATRAHEASGPSRSRRSYTDRLGPNDIVQQGARGIRAGTRHSARNHDIARGIIRTMVNNVVGANGIGIEPQPRRKDGTIHEEYAADLRRMGREWFQRPEVTWRFPWAKCQRMQAWAWMRDGEVFSQDVIGTVPGLEHGSAVPYSLELFEADFVPLDFNDAGNGITQGVERNAWGRPRAYWVYKGNPLETLTAPVTDRSSLKRVDAWRVRHIAFLDHIGQVRGISEFASILARLEDIKDYEESERIAAKVAASLTAYIKKAAGPDGYDSDGVKKDENGNPIGRDLRMTPGMIIDRLSILAPGLLGGSVARAVRHYGVTRHTTLWARRPELAREISEGRRNSDYLPGINLPVGLRATSRLDLALAGAEQVFVSVPRVYEKMQARILEKAGAATGVKAALFKLAMSAGTFNA